MQNIQSSPAPGLPMVEPFGTNRKRDERGVFGAFK